MNLEQLPKSGLAAVALFLTLIGASASAHWQPRDDWAAIFDQAGVAGTIAVLDLRQGEHLGFVHNAERVRVPFIPASTFKVPHTLFALDAGVVADEFEILEWDGEPRWLDTWNQDQDLRSAMRNSVVWVYQGFARAIGEERSRDYLKRLDYGNADPSDGIGRYWIDGELRISAIEQIEFLRKLYFNELPFRVEHQRLVKDLIINAATPACILRAKTGWTTAPEPDIGWWVGWIESPRGPVFFALNIDMPRGRADAPRRLSITRNVLRTLGDPGSPGPADCIEQTLP